jgi:hypothetical protein
VPRHTDKETTIVTEISRPPVLRIAADLSQILLELVVVNRVESLGVVEVLAVGVGDGAVLTKDVGLEGLGPPLLMGNAVTSDVGDLVGDGTLSLVGHFGS